MNQLRKIMQWAWLNKERMVLAVMVGFLVFRVYQVVNPGAGDDGRIFRPPGSNLDPEMVPGKPSPLPRTTKSEDWSRLWRDHMLGGGMDVRASTSQNRDTPEVEIELIRIRETQPGQYRAQIKTSSRTGWYSEGDAFEAFEIISIDSEENCVVVFSEQVERPLEICVE